MTTVQPTTFPDQARSQGTAVLYRTMVSLAIFLSVLLIAGVWHLGANSMIACGFLGAWFIHLGARPPLAHTGLAAGSGAILGLLYKAMGGAFGPGTFALVVELGAFLGLGSILVTSLDRIWTGSSRFSACLRDALILPVFSLIAGLCMQFVNAAAHTSFDFLLYRFDASLGLTPGVTVVAWYRELPWLQSASSLTYAGLLIFPPLYHGWLAYRAKTARIHLMLAFIVAGVGGFVLYQICPAMGPLYAFGQQFPDHLPALGAVAAKGFTSTGVNNAMPSMHMTWALLVWVAAWELGPLSLTIASVFVTFTGLATVGSGEHYLIDLVVSVPLVMMVYGICTRRRRLAVTGLGLVVAWTVYLRLGIQLPAAIHWCFVAGTILATGWLMRQFLTTRAAPAD